MAVPLNQVVNPTNEQRHEMIRNSLESAGRPEDYEYIVNLLSPPPDITSYASPGELKGVRIGVIGGGLAGLSAAFELRKLGADITILEANDNRIGGRVYPLYDLTPQERSTPWAELDDYAFLYLMMQLPPDIRGQSRYRCPAQHQL
ncbi:MAG: FAD-dependent oxidoreductase [Hungatella sp.]|jgi:NADPH-dependent 2,4-dienoyl-CoA reductase/sulfur reductase-like enzyme|nr:FAD-dependent oxidoreductase [Hungatella sp.]